MTTLRAELQAERDASAAERAATASEHAASLEANAKSSHASLHERLEADHEKHVVLNQQSAAPRIANRGIAMGFSAWQKQWEEAARQKRMLMAAAGGLERPAGPAEVAHWVRDWRLKGMSNQEQRQLSKEASLHEELWRQYERSLGPLKRNSPRRRRSVWRKHPLRRA